jgi:phosphatidylglycerophosphate synthase
VRLIGIDLPSLLRRNMLDARIRHLIDPPLNRVGQKLAGVGMTADGLTVMGFGLGILAAAAIAFGWFSLGLVLFVAGRVLDGLDGAVARATAKTDRGGYLDIVLDFAVYAALPLAFAVYDPSANALAAATVLAAIVCNGSAFLAFAVMAERRGLESRAQGEKSLYFVAGLAEGTETIAIYAACCIWPIWFAALAYAFAGLCLASGLARIALAWRLLR